MEASKTNMRTKQLIIIGSVITLFFFLYVFITLDVQSVPILCKCDEFYENRNSIDRYQIVQENEKPAAYKEEQLPKEEEEEEEEKEEEEENKNDPVLEKVLNITKCMDKNVSPKIEQRGEYWVLYNYIIAEESFRCHESITYTTHGDYSFIDNLVPLLKRWQGPISIALHAPGTDFEKTVHSIAYLRDCTDVPVKKLVTFHIFFNNSHIPEDVPKYKTIFDKPYNCSTNPPYLNVKSEDMYKTIKDLTYPINLARNVAREFVQTHFILPLDVEIYPSPNFISKFLTMIGEDQDYMLRKKLKVFPIYLFEIEANQNVPETKEALREMINNKTAISFHKNICSSCHNFPETDYWLKTKETEKLRVFHAIKRTGTYHHWEPFYVMTTEEPFYDDRFTWDGMLDKHIQAYVLCLLDYDFILLDNVFLIHKPGIKHFKEDKRRKKYNSATIAQYNEHIKYEYKKLYGDRDGCKL